MRMEPTFWTDAPAGGTVSITPKPKEPVPFVEIEQHIGGLSQVIRVPLSGVHEFLAAFHAAVSWLEGELKENISDEFDRHA